ncbi:glycosyltransferase family 2 protein [Enterococcus canintestini]|uniref:glycosyltransferase family 2 protein n=1 Tax=Enterococcus canintestini TaxID=317010 RepID=UPI002890C59E|nr:glycosyltransferase family 2 protein [Enterococcus canintestini]MDT2740336.1 glycosyltransferase family 2 protein [Enterococcus canintestini]
MISFVIPMYNSEKTISKVLDSIFLQSYLPEYEIIIVDDGSVDNSVKVVEKVSETHPEIKLIKQKNCKQAVARNNGLKNVLGEFVCFIDSDDLLKKNYLYDLLSPLNTDNRLSLSIGGIEKVFESGKESIVENESVLENAQNKQKLLSLYLTKNSEMDVGLWNKVFKTEIIRENNINFKNSNFFEDSFFVLEYLENLEVEQIFFSNHVVYELFKGGESTTTSFKPEIDQLAKKYINFVGLKVQAKDLSNDVFAAFKIRTILHVVHHHIKYDHEWSSSKQVSLFKNSGIGVPFSRLLSIKYNVASIFARTFPKIYIKLYRGR